MGMQALAGVKVLEYCRGISGPYCTKLMADLGAEVVHIESPGKGDDTRRLPPFAGDEPHPEKSGIFLFLNTNKLGITLDPAMPAGREIFRKLASGADVVVEDWPAGHMQKLGLGYDDLRTLNPALIVTSITPFGQSGPYRDYKAYDLNIAHASGQGYMLPSPVTSLDRPPVRIGGHCTDYDCGQTTALAILAAIFARHATGRGQYIDVSQQEAILSLQRVENVVFANHGQVLPRTGQTSGPPKDPKVTQVFHCRDGWVVSCAPLEHMKAGLAKMVEEAVGPTDGVPEEEVDARLKDWMQQQPKAEVCAKAQSLGVPMSPLSSPEDVATSPQINGRNFFAEVEHPVAGKLRMPARLSHFSATPIELRHAAPLLGEHNDMIFRDRLGLGADELRQLRQAGVL